MSLPVGLYLDEQHWEPFGPSTHVCHRYTALKQTLDAYAATLAAQIDKVGLREQWQADHQPANGP